MMKMPKPSIDNIANSGIIKKAAALSVAAMLCFSLASCGSRGGDGGDVVFTDSTSPADIGPETEKVYLHGGDPDNKVWAEAYLESLPERDFDGVNFFITATDTTMLDPSSVDMVSETVSERNRALEEKYNISLRTEKADIATMTAEAKKAFLAGTYYTDIMAVPFEEVGSLAAEGVLANLRSLPLLNFYEPYFNTSSAKALSVGNVTYGIAGEATPMALDLPVTVFNRDLLASLSSVDLYAEALEGKFTWDRFFEIASLADGADEAGAVCAAGDTTSYIFASVGESFVTSHEKTVPTVAFFNYSMDKAASCYRKIVANGQHKGIAPDGAADSFSSGGALLSVCSMRELDSYRSEGVNIGILPMPKLTEDAEYRSLVGGDALILTAAAGSTNSELVSLAMSGICAASYGYITEEYVNYIHATTLPDNRSADILDLISDTAYYDLSTAFIKTVPEIREGTVDLVGYIIETGDFTYFSDMKDGADRAMSDIGNY